MSTFDSKKQSRKKATLLLILIQLALSLSAISIVALNAYYMSRIGNKLDLVVQKVENSNQKLAEANQRMQALLAKHN